MAENTLQGANHKPNPEAGGLTAPADACGAVVAAGVAGSSVPVGPAASAGHRAVAAATASSSPAASSVPVTSASAAAPSVPADVRAGATAPAGTAAAQAAPTGSREETTDPAAPSGTAASAQDVPVRVSATPPDAARLAVFDYDGTIIDGQSGSLFSRYLLSKNLISLRTGSRLLWWGTRYKLHLPYRQDEARELIFRDLGSRGYDEAVRIMRAFHDEVLAPRYRVDAIQEVMRRKEEGCVTLLISATFSEIARVAATALGMDGFAATCMERDTAGNFTGRVQGEVVAGEGKCRAVRAWADERYGEGAWRVAYAYGDHFTDEPLLASAEHPFCVCPGKTLHQIARRRSWPILNWK